MAGQTMIPLMNSAFRFEDKAKRDLAKFILNTSRFSMGEECRKFEESFAKEQRQKHGVLFNSGGSANLALLQALKNLGRLNEGSRVGVSCLTWSTNVMPVLQLGMVPTAIDVEVKTLNCSVSTLDQIHKEKRLDCFFITNALGFAGNLVEIKTYCDENDILLIEDNCESLGAEIGEKKTGSYGVGASFSFYVAHHMSTIEGGMICTDDTELYNMLQLVRANGWDRNLAPEEQHRLRKIHGIRDEFSAKYAFYDLGFNLRPTEITGFLGNSQLKYLDDSIKRRAMNHQYLEGYVESNPDLMSICHSHMSRISPFAFPVICRSSELREVYMRRFSGNGIEIRPMIAGNIQKQPFFKRYVGSANKTVGADFLDECSFYCANDPEMTPSDLEVIRTCLIK